MNNVEKIREAIGDPKKWEYRGNCCDRKQKYGESYHTPYGGVCSCTQKYIRYEFEIVNIDDARTAIIGSTCIEHFAQLNSVEAGRMEDDFRKLREYANISEQIKSLSIGYEEARRKVEDVFQNFKRKKMMAPKPVWKICQSDAWFMPLSASELIEGVDFSTAARRKLQDSIEEIQNVLAVFGEIVPRRIILKDSLECEQCQDYNVSYSGTHIGRGEALILAKCNDCSHEWKFQTTNYYLQ